MAEPPALFDDETTPETKSEEPSSLFGETTEITLEADDTKEAEPAKVEAGSDDESHETKEKAEPEASPAASVDVTNLPEKEVETPKPKAEVKV